MKKMLEVKNLQKVYVTDKQENQVLKNINFFVEEAEMVAVMGPSGSGKSTLLYTVSSMDFATAGTVSFNNQIINKLPKAAIADIRLNEMGFIFQQMYMLKNLTIFDNIVLPAFQSKLVRRKERQKKRRYAEELMQKMGIKAIAKHGVNEVSGGQLQRACVCRSLINQPKMIFADEPTGALNKQASADVMEELTKINQAGTTILLVTHDAKVAVKSERIIYLVDGEIIGECQLGKYQEDGDLKAREATLNNWLFQMGW